MKTLSTIFAGTCALMMAGGCALGRLDLPGDHEVHGYARNDWKAKRDAEVQAYTRRLETIKEKMVFMPAGWRTRALRAALQDIRNDFDQLVAAQEWEWRAEKDDFISAMTEVEEKYSQALKQRFIASPAKPNDDWNQSHMSTPQRIIL